MSLITLERVYLEQGLQVGDDVSLDALVTSYINAASSMLESQTNREFGDVRTVTEKVSQPSGRTILQVSQALPLVEILEVKFKDEVIDQDSYEIDHSGAGFIRKKSSSWTSSEFRVRGIETYFGGPQHLYEVTYRGGEGVPYDIEFALVDQVSLMLARRGQDKGASSLKTGDWGVTYSSEGMLHAPSFDAVVKRYRRVVVA